MKHQTQSRLHELEPLPELLRSSELRLQQMTGQLEEFKQLHDHDMSLINDLTAKVMYCNAIANNRNVFGGRGGELIKNCMYHNVEKSICLELTMNCGQWLSISENMNTSEF